MANQTRTDKQNRCLLPTKPTVVFCGAQQSREFSDAAYAVRDVLSEVEAIPPEDYDEHNIAKAIATRLSQLVDLGGNARAGALAAAAHWIAVTIDGRVPDASKWIPLEQMEWDSEGVSIPPAHSTFFNVAGTPVSVSPDLVSRKWAAESYGRSYEFMSTEVVRVLGKSITRKKFDKMCPDGRE